LGIPIFSSPSHTILLQYTFFPFIPLASHPYGDNPFCFSSTSHNTIPLGHTIFFIYIPHKFF
jgi:hypothetical protein